MITLKDYVEGTFPNHDTAMKMLSMTKTTFYRRLKDPCWKVITIKVSENLKKQLVVNVYQEITVTENKDGALLNFNSKQERPDQCI